MGVLVWTGGAAAWGLQGMNVARHPQLTGAAPADTGTLGLSGDAGVTAGGDMPAGWVANMTGGVTIAGTAGGDQALVGSTPAQIAAALATRTRIEVQFTTVPDIGAPTGNVAWVVTKNAASPWRATLTLRGNPDAATVDAEVWVEYLWSASAGRA